jgi:photosystem II stability/assembly factor-like uncharacterized protein
MTGNLDMGSNRIFSTSDPSGNDELTRKGYVDQRIQNAGGNSIIADIDVADTSESVNVDGANSQAWTNTGAPGNTNYYNVATSYNGRYVTAVIYDGFLQVSNDAGVSFTAYGISARWLGICMSNSGQYQAAVIENGNVYVSSNFGVNWVARGATQAWRPVGQPIAMSGDGKYIIGVTGSGYLYRSADFGNTWSNVSISLSGNSVYGIAMSASGRYVAYSSLVASIAPEVNISSDYGMTFTVVSLPPGGGNMYGIAMSASGQYISTFRRGVSVYISNNYGATWSTIAFGFNSETISMSGSGQLQVIGTTGQIYRSVDYGNTWAQTGSTAGTWYGVAVSRAGNRVYASNFPGSVARLGMDVMTYNSIVPFPTNTSSLGASGRNWTTVWTQNGTVSTSDSSLKDWVDLPYGLNEVNKMRTIKYKWKNQANLPDDDPTKNFEYYGFCADELAEVFPELVYNENKDAPIQMNYSEILPVVINAVKELKNQKDELEAKFDAVINWLKNTQGFVLPSI